MSSPTMNISPRRKSLFGGIYLVLSLLIFAFSVYQLSTMPASATRTSQPTQLERTSTSTRDSSNMLYASVNSYTY
ncbi:MAG: hypothetical protein AAF267_00655 [Deinococcota bacterium]